MRGEKPGGASGKIAVQRGGKKDQGGQAEEEGVLVAEKLHAGRAEEAQPGGEQQKHYGQEGLQQGEPGQTAAGRHDSGSQ